jgi:AcrR family transcriptional regulator
MAETTGSARSTDEKQDDVRHRILLAAREEFAAHGLAGARVDRIARSGRSTRTSPTRRRCSTRC